VNDSSPVILITGASSGIGAATARVFGKHGYRVVLAARRYERLEAVATEIRSAGGESLPVAVDVGNWDEIRDLVQLILMRYNRIDLLFNNAGFGRLGWLEDLEVESDIENQVRVNLLGVIHSTRAVLPQMIAQRRGHVINMSSLAGMVASPTYSLYSATKFGVRGFTEALRREVGVYNIQVTGIYPGSVVTEFKQLSGAKRKTGTTTPAWLRLSPEQVAEVVFKVAKKPRRTVIIPAPMHLPVWLNALAPGLVDWVIERRFTRIERD
jgi:NADP-dependent 3-hydroxy acid dehydrogenase YdfG